MNYLNNLGVSFSIRRSALSLISASFSLIALGCGVESTSPHDTGGIGGAGGVGGAGAIDGGAESQKCPSGVTVVLSDYISTQIALSSLDGKTQSESLISTGSSRTDGLAFALSGDVVLPHTPPTSGEVVLLDRYGTNVITWINPKSGKVRQQLPVGTGYESNPQDYLEVSQSIAWVTRFGQNASPGALPFDDGGDILVIDLKNNKIVENIVMPTADELPARPGSMSRIKDEVFVSLDRIALDFSTVGEAMVVSMDPSSRTENFHQTLKGHKACGAMMSSPDGKTLAMACTGALSSDGSIEDLDQSAVLLFDTNQRPLVITERIQAADILGIPLQGSLTFIDNDSVLLKTQTPYGGAGNNELFSLNLKTKKSMRLLAARTDKNGLGKGLVYGTVFCAPGCSDVCLMSDADRGVIQVLELSDDGTLSTMQPQLVEDKVGLPPLGICGR